MEIEHDFVIDEGPGTSGEGPVDRDPPSPLVVIEYRDRWLHPMLIPPLLILLAASAIGSYRRLTPVHALALVESSRNLPAPGPGPGRAIAVESPASGASSGPIETRPSPAAIAEPSPALPAPPSPPKDQEAPAPAPEPTPRPIAAPPSGPGGPNGDPSPAPTPKGEVALAARVPALPLPEPEREAKGHDRAAETLDPAPRSPQPEPQPEVTTETVLDQIRREAEEKAAELRKIEAIRPRLRALELAETRRKNQEARLLFHNELRQVLATATRPDRAGEEIEALSDRYGRTTLDEIQDSVRRALKRSYGGLSRSVKVEMMRGAGLPEPMILDYLAHEIHKTLGTRGGPRSEDEVRVRAARTLLLLPPAAARSRSSARTSRPPGPGAAPPVPPGPQSTQ